MATNLFVGSLAYSATDDDLQQFFAAVGNVVSAKVIMDRESGRSKGFGFVEMSTDAEAAEAITKFNGADYAGRAMTVNEAKPMAPREDRGGGRGFGGGGGRGGRY
jgi:RNA recognition motif-containing protein